MNNEQLTQIRRLYQDDRKGLRVISRLTGVPAATVRRYLIKAGCYRESARVNATQKEEEPASLLEQETTESLPALDLARWEAKGVSVECVDHGWLLNLGSGFANELVSPPLGEGWSGKGIEFSVGVLGSGALRFGVKDVGFPYGSEGVCFLQGGYVPSHWHIKHLCQASPVLFFRGNSYQEIVVHVSTLMVKAIPGVGLKPVPLPVEEKRLEAGTRINLMDKWQADGCRCKRFPNGLEVEFLAFGSLYLDLPFEVWEREICFVMEMLSYSSTAQVKMVVGDNKNEERKIISVGREPGKQQLELAVGQKAYARLKNSGYDRFTTFLSDAFCVVIS